MFHKTKWSVCLLLLVVGIATSGCSGGNDPVKEAPAELDKRVETAKTIRELHDKSQGNYDSLSAEDKAKLDKVTGGEANSKKAFSLMR